MSLMQQVFDFNLIRHYLDSISTRLKNNDPRKGFGMTFQFNSLLDWMMVSCSLIELSGISPSLGNRSDGNMNGESGSSKNV